MRVKVSVQFVMAMMLGVATVAKADTINQPVSGSGGGFSGSGTLTATSNSGNNGSYTIQSISGDYVTGLIQAGHFEGNDNQLYPMANQLVSANGFAFTATEGDTNFDVDIFAQGNGYAAHVEDLDTGMVEDTDVTLSVSSGNAAPVTSHAALTSFLRGGVNTGTETFQFSFGPAAQAATVTPEPASFALLGTGFLGLAGIVRRRMQ